VGYVTVGGALIWFTNNIGDLIGGQEVVGFTDKFIAAGWIGGIIGLIGSICVIAGLITAFSGFGGLFGGKGEIAEEIVEAGGVKNIPRNIKKRAKELWSGRDDADDDVDKAAKAAIDGDQEKVNKHLLAAVKTLQKTGGSARTAATQLTQQNEALEGMPTQTGATRAAEARSVEDIAAIQAGEEQIQRAQATLQALAESGSATPEQVRAAGNDASAAVQGTAEAVENAQKDEQQLEEVMQPLVQRQHAVEAVDKRVTVDEATAIKVDEVLRDLRDRLSAIDKNDKGAILVWGEDFKEARKSINFLYKESPRMNRELEAVGRDVKKYGQELYALMQVSRSVVRNINKTLKDKKKPSTKILDELITRIDGLLALYKELKKELPHAEAR